jgi:glycosyltransferase involved in cell wall biosynthesis
MAQVSIITIVKNNSPGLRKSLISALSQSFKNWECLVIVANSEDLTWNTALEFQDADSRIKVFKEIRNGIYPAMNQGVSTANSEYLVFMNAGDQFSDPESLDVLAREIESGDYSLVVGGYRVEGIASSYSFRRKNFYELAFSLNRRWGCHQSMIFRSDVITCIGAFSENYEIASDFDLVLKALAIKKGLRIPQIISCIEPEGLSDTQIWKVLYEKQKSRRMNHQVISNSYILGGFWTAAVATKIICRKIFRKITS